MKKFLIFLLLSSLFVGCAPTANAALQASGLIEATEIAVAPELSGRVVEVLVTEGDFVKAGDPLLFLDDSLLQAEKRMLDASLDSANAIVKTAQSALEMAQLQYDQKLDAVLIAESETRVDIWTETKPGEFDQPTWYFDRDERYQATLMEVDAAKANLDSQKEKLSSLEKQVESTAFLEAEKKLTKARIAFAIAESVRDRASSGELRDAADTAYDDAKLDLDDAQADYDDILTTDDANDLLEARARVNIAQERYDTAMDTLRAFQTGTESPEIVMAAKAVEQAEAGLESAKMAVKQAQAQLLLFDAQMEKLTLYAPLDGIVLVRSIQPGEVIQAGETTMTIAQLDTLTVTVYISEDRYGEVVLGDKAFLSVDSFPDETFTATVTRIADQVEYTPRNVQTKEERQTTVYAIELSVENPVGKLKPGMPVDVTF